MKRKNKDEVRDLYLATNWQILPSDKVSGQSSEVSGRPRPSEPGPPGRGYPPREQLSPGRFREVYSRGGHWAGDRTKTLPNQTSCCLRNCGHRKSALYLWRSQDPQTLDSRRPGTHSARALNSTPSQGSAASLTPRTEGFLHSGPGAQPAWPGCPRVSEALPQGLTARETGTVTAGGLRREHSVGQKEIDITLSWKTRKTNWLTHWLTFQG